MAFNRIGCCQDKRACIVSRDNSKFVTSNSTTRFMCTMYKKMFCSATYGSMDFIYMLT